MVGVETCDVPDLENATRSKSGNVTYGSNCKDNTSKDPFSRCATCKNYGHSLI